MGATPSEVQPLGYVDIAPQPEPEKATRGLHAIPAGGPHAQPQARVSLTAP